MSGKAVCHRCHAEVDRNAPACLACGASRRKQPGLTWVWAVVGVFALVLLAMAGSFVWKRQAAGQIDPQIEAELESRRDFSAVEIPGVMRMSYVDVGDSIEITIVSKSNPILYLDLNQNHVVDKGDVSYAALPGNQVCVTALAVGGAACETVGSSAVVRVSQADDVKTAVWTISKRKLGSGRSSADIAIRTFHENTQQGEYYPAEPFQKVYRLKFLGDPHESADLTPPVPATNSPTEPQKDSTRAMNKMPVEAPSRLAQAVAKPRAPEILQFDAPSINIQRGGSAQLLWSVHGMGSTEVQIEPELGVVALQGQRAVSPVTTTRYLLKATGPGGISSRELTIAVSTPVPPVVASFTSDVASVSPGGTVRLQWSVTGAATSVKIDPLGSGLPLSGYRDVTVARTTSFLLTAEGPGGSITNTVNVRAMPRLPTVIFDSSPAIVHAGEAVVLNWATSGATQVSIQPDFGDVPLSGSETLHLLTTTRYTIFVNGPGGSISQTATVHVTQPSVTSRGRLIWSGEVHGTQLVTIDHDHADMGNLAGALPGLPCILQPVDTKNVSVASSPGPRNQYQRLVFRVKGNGLTKVIIDWSLQ